MKRTNFFSLHSKRVRAKNRHPQERKKRRIAGFAAVGVFTLLIALGVVRLMVDHFPVIGCANSISCVGDLSGSYESGKISQFMGETVPVPVAPDISGVQSVLGDATGTKHIYVDLSTQRLTAFAGARKVFIFPVSTGKWGRTPQGDFHIWIKLRYTHMEGGSRDDGTYYNLYNVPYTMFFYNDEVPKSAGFSLHGAYWHNNFGHPMSHGCVNLRPEDAAILFAWADPKGATPTTYATAENTGTLVTISGELAAE